MSSLPNDIQLIVCKYLHYSLTIDVNEEYTSEYLNQGWWDENSNCFRFANRIPKMMYRMQDESGRWGFYYYCDQSVFIYSKHVGDKKGIIVADLPKNY